MWRGKRDEEDINWAADTQDELSVSGVSLSLQCSDQNIDET